MEWVSGFMGNENEIKNQLTTPIKESPNYKLNSIKNNWPVSSTWLVVSV